MGAIMVYGSYMPDDASIGKTVLLVGFFDTLIALMAGMIIFPLVFANGMESDQSVGLMFKTLPIVFGQMPGGVIFGSIFFALVTIAALSSSVSLIEPGVAWLQGKGHSRTKAVTILGVIAWSGGVLCIYWGSVFDFLDNMTTRFTLPIGGLLIAIFVGWAMPKALVSENFENSNSLVYTGWMWCLRIVAPAGVLIVFASNMGMLG
jgi:NSS family neurotransmitter:Na+ symporter